MGKKQGKLPGDGSGDGGWGTIKSTWGGLKNRLFTGGGGAGGTRRPPVLPTCAPPAAGSCRILSPRKRPPSGSCSVPPRWCSPPRLQPAVWSSPGPLCPLLWSARREEDPQVSSLFPPESAHWLWPRPLPEFASRRQGWLLVSTPSSSQHPASHREHSETEAEGLKELNFHPKATHNLHLQHPLQVPQSNCFIALEVAFFIPFFFFCLKLYALLCYLGASQVGLVVKNLPANARDVRDTASIPGWERSPGGGKGSPLQYSCLENPMDRGAWRATVHGVTKSRTRLKWLSAHTQNYNSLDK